MTSGIAEHRRRRLSRWLDSINGTWRLKAACNPSTGTAVAAGWTGPIPDMFAESLNRQREAASFCHQVCPVQQECLQWANDQGDGNYVLGGTTERERRHLQRKARQDRRESA